MNYDRIALYVVLAIALIGMLVKALRRGIYIQAGYDALRDMEHDEEKPEPLRRTAGKAADQLKRRHPFWTNYDDEADLKRLRDRKK